MSMSTSMRRTASIAAVAALLAAVGGPARAETAAADDGKAPATAPADYFQHCQVWPAGGSPPEHRPAACDKAAQNARWVADDAAAKALTPAEKVSDAAYFGLPEERTWACPLDAAGDDWAGPLGRVTRWIVHNEASTPVVLSHVNALGVEVSATDFRTSPAHADTAAYPHGPVLPPGQFAVVEGRQGQTFVVREYREILPAEAMLAAGEDEAVRTSWDSFKSVLPSTLSFLPEQTRYKTGKGVWHILGKPGRVLLKHRMGNILIKNQFGAVAPPVATVEESLAAVKAAATDAKGNPKKPVGQDKTPGCNVMKKAFLNTLDFPVDVYFAPRNKIDGDDYNCERFQDHLGTRAAYDATDPATRHLDDRASPMKFPNSYNGHAFVARAAHDQALVARIEIDHDVVRDCPEPARGRAAVAAQDRAPVLQGVLGGILANATPSAYASEEWQVAVRANVTSSPVLSKNILPEKFDIAWQNHTGVLLASMPIAS